ncbi:MAG: IMPACT family protein [bacterium]
MPCETYLTVKSPASTEIRIKDSRFFAHLYHANSRESAEKILTGISQMYASATHNCSAYRVGIGDNCIFRLDDAGEPTGTAGKPILQALETRTISDSVLIVTRYFGGTKLGIGGLIRAYSSAAFAVLDVAKLYPVQPMAKIKFSFGFHDTGNIHKIINTFHALILRTKYDNKVRMELSVSENEKEKLLKSLNDVTRGEVEFE